MRIISLICNKMPCPLVYNIISECPTSKARVGELILPHSVVDTPVFMPVGTQGTLKALLPEQIDNLGIKILLANTYHLGTRPGPAILDKAGGLHKFMNWHGSLLTDSGGFQMVSLKKLSNVTEEGVKFQPLNHQKDEVMLTPEHSIHIQNSIGADIVMQLDDVIQTTSPDRDRIEESVHRTTRWLDRCLRAHRKPESQSIFPIIQGTLYADLRTLSAKSLVQRDVNGFAIGGLSGGESKDDFWKMVHLSTDILPKHKPRYLMGVGFAIDLVVCSALGVDMFDCVFPTRTARFGCGLTMRGQLNLKDKVYKRDFRPIDDACSCSTCQTYTRAYLHGIVTVQAAACNLLTVHNLAFQGRLMREIRESIKEKTFPRYVQTFFANVYPDKDYPTWIVQALAEEVQFYSEKRLKMIDDKAEISEAEAYTPGNPNDPKNVQELTQYVQSLLQTIQDKFQNMSDQILTRIDEMGTRIDDLEKNIGDLMTQAGVDGVEKWDK